MPSRKIQQHLEANISYYLGYLVLLWVVLINLFPEGYVLVGGDMAQTIELKENFSRLFYDWQGRVSFYYFFFYLLEHLGVDADAQLSVYLGSFLFISYFSFNFFLRRIFSKIRPLSRLLLSLFYALNFYTLYVFTYSWGYSQYQLLYAFIPLITACFILFLKHKTWRHAIGFWLSLFLASQTFSNPAFGLSLAIYLWVLFVALSLSKYFQVDKQLMLRLPVLLSVSFLLNAYWILPVLPQINEGVDNLFTNNIIDLDWWLRSTSNPLIDTLRLMQYNSWYFPDNMPYQHLQNFKWVFRTLAFVPVLLIILAAKSKLEGEKKKYFYAFLLVFLVFVALVGKVRTPFELINNWFYHTWGLNTLRSYEKLAIFTPFLMAALLAVLAEHLSSLKNRANVFFNVTLLIILLLPLPFYLGKLQQNTSAVFVRDGTDISKKDYQKAEYSFLVEIPAEYYEIRSLINNDPADVKIATLPYSVIDSIGWVNYPKWKLTGTDITRYLFNKDLVEANHFCFANWMCSQDFNQSEVDPSWMLKWLGSRSVKYIIYHYDVEDNFVRQGEEKISQLEKRGEIKLLEINSYFALYEIKADYVWSALTIINPTERFEPNAQNILQKYDKINAERQNIKIEKITPKKYALTVPAIQETETLVLSEPFSNNWRAYLETESGLKKLTNHYPTLGNFNGWQIEPGLSEQEIIVEYYPIRLAYIGITLSSLTILSLIISLIFTRYVKRNT